MTSADGRLAGLPKADLHVHLPGCVRAGTLAELAARNGVDLPLPAARLYGRINSDPTPEERARGPWFPLLRVYELICASLRTADDFARVVYEALEDGLRVSNVRYAEPAFSPSVHLAAGVPYRAMAEGIAAGIAAARRDLGVDARAIAAVNREDTPAAALAMVEEVAAYPAEEVCAVGLDFDERRGLPERFAGAFALAGRHGLRRTAHASEHVPSAACTTTCLDLLGCDRIDHGYHVLKDDGVVARCRDEGVPFNVAFTTSRRALRPWRRASIAEMAARGLRLTINSDDPALFPTTLTREYALAAETLGAAAVPDLARTAVHASFAPDDIRRSLLADIAAWEAAGRS